MDPLRLSPSERAREADPHYIPYWAHHFSGNNLKLEMTKKEIFDQHINRQINRRKQAENKAKQLGSEELKAVRTLLSGKGMEKFQEIEDKPTYKENDLSFIPETQAAALKIIETGQGKIESVSEFVDLLNQYLATFPKAAQAIYPEYVDQLVEKIANSHSKNVTAYDDVDSRIIAGLLGRYNMDMFKTGSGHIDVDIPTVIGKIAALAKALPSVAGSNQTFTVRNSKNSKTSEASSDAELIDAALGKAKAWIQEANQAMLEVSKGLLKLKGDKIVAEALSKVEHSFKLTANDFCDVNLTLSPFYEDMYHGLEKGLARMKGVKRSKADFGVWVGEEDTGVFIGVNAKNYRLNTKDHTSSASFKIQDGTPLLTLLIREIGYSPLTIHEIIGLGAVHAVGDDFDFINKEWKELVNQIKMRSVFSALAGLENTIDQSYFMAIDGVFYRMEDVLLHLRDHGTIQFLTKRGKTGTPMEYGLLRSTYTKINYWHQKRVALPNAEEALARAKDTRTQAYRIMYNTKVSVQITMNEMASFAKMGLLN